jgi:hypothetical protein
MKKIIMCSMLIAATLPSVAIASTAGLQVQEPTSTCRIKSVRMISENELEVVYICTTNANGSV